MANDKIYVVFGSAVATRRKALGLTQAQLAGRVQMSRASIANVESGRQSILLHHVYALASALDLTRVADLLPQPLQKSTGEELKVTLSSQSLWKQTLSNQAEAQVVGLINSALEPRRGTGARS